MIILYNIVLLAFFLPALAALALRHRKRFATEFMYGFTQKLGFWRLPSPASSPLVWIHCASLGEIRAVEPLLRQLPGYRTLVTTMTYAGYEYAQKRNVCENIRFAPLDFSFIVNPLFRKIKPSVLVIVETELWPGLLHAARKYGAKTVIVNGRLSNKSYPYYRLFRPLLKEVFAGVSHVAARSDEDAARFIGLGCAPDRVSVTGNIKYDRDFTVQAGTREAAGFVAGDIIWTCGSTREGEEGQLLDVFADVKRKYPALKMVLAPRHINRIPAVRRLLEERQVSFRVRSDAVRQCDVLLVDTFGELQKLYALSDIVFVGGSLVDKGGQNPIEPAAAGKPVLFGPHMENFLTEAKILLEAGGAMAVSDAAALSAGLDAFCGDAAGRLRAGQKAQKAVEQQRGALERTMKVLRAAAMMP